MTKIKKIIKRDGTEVIFNPGKIINAISMAFQEVYGIADSKIVLPIASSVAAKAHIREDITVEDIQDLIMTELSSRGYHKVLRAFSQYRYKHEYLRLMESAIGIVNATNEEVGTENANKNAVLASTQRDLIAGEVSKAIARKMVDKDIMHEHDLGFIKLHDGDYIMSPIFNCDLVNLKDMFENGTVINKKKINTPKSLRTAMTLATQIAAQVSSSQYGGQTMSLAHISPFVRVSENKIREELVKTYKEEGIFVSDTQLESIVKRRLKKEIVDAVQTFNYQISTLMTTNGQAPFITLGMYISEEEEYEKETAMLIEEFLRQRIEGMENEFGIKASQTFPKLVYILDENNTEPEHEYYYLTELAAKSVAKRLSPDFVSAKRFKEVHGVDKPWFPMGCRSFLSKWINEDGKVQSYGRGNLGVVTMNLPMLALRYKEEGDSYTSFVDYLEDYMNNIIFRACMFRYNKLEGVKAEVAPILWQHGAIARLKPDDLIQDVMKDGRFTVSIGYGGMFECSKILTGESHTTEKGSKLALEIMQLLDRKAQEYKKETGLGFGIYGTPAESTNGHFRDKIVAKYGEIEGVTEKGFITNSFHVDVQEEIDAFTKLDFESQFEELSKGGVITYVETPNMEKNIEAVLQVINHIYNTVIYGEINTESDCCGKCGYSGAMDNNGSKWVCPCCGNDDQHTISVVRRVCGYLGENVFSPGRLKDILARVKHL